MSQKTIATSDSVESLFAEGKALVVHILAHESVTQIALAEVAALPKLFGAIMGLRSELASNKEGVINSVALGLGDLAKLVLK